MGWFHCSCTRVCNNGSLSIDSFRLQQLFSALYQLTLLWGGLIDTVLQMADEMKTHILWLPTSLTILQLHSYEQWWEFGEGKKIPQCRQGLRVSLNVLFWVLFVSRSHASLKHSPSHLQIADYEAAAAVGSTSWMKRNEWRVAIHPGPPDGVHSRFLCLLFSFSPLYPQRPEGIHSKRTRENKS